jgi:uncharacterized membrane protein YfcA
VNLPSAEFGLVFFLISMIFSSVGLGGGCAYTALLVLLGVPHYAAASTALSLNLIVSAQGSWNYYRRGHLSPDILIPFAISSIPLAFVGASIEASKELFTVVLSIALLIIAIRLIFFRSDRYLDLRKSHKRRAWGVGLPAGAVLGFVAGLCGLGGAVFLVPAIILLRLGNPKEAAACGILFVLLNSASGLVGHILRGTVDPGMVLPLAIPVLIGGQIGSRLGAGSFRPATVTRVLAAVLLFISLKLGGSII